MISTDTLKRDNRPAGTSREGVTASELADILNVSKRALNKRCNKENWAFSEIPHPGGSKRVFTTKTLPDDIRLKIQVHFGEIPAEFAANGGSWTPDQVRGDRQGRIDQCAKDWACAADWQKDRAEARRTILEALDKFQDTFKGGCRQAVIEFAALYMKREAPGLDPGIYDDVKNVSTSRLYEWAAAFRNDGIAGLISRHGSNLGRSHMPLEQQNFILAAIAHNPDLRPVRIFELLGAKFNGTAVSNRDVRVFLNRKRKQEPGVFCYLNSPDDYRSNFELALGNASEKATHLLHYVEVDSTNGEIQCSDGKRYNICGLIDVFSRKAQFVVTPTSNSWAIAGLLWATILDWGLPENLIRDRGKDFASKHISRALASVETRVIELPPFTPQGKPHIERMFRTLTHGLFEILPGYLGHNVADRKAIESRKSFADRLLKKGECIELGLTPAELQTAINHWTEQVYHQRNHSSLGASPNAKAASVPNRPRRIEDREALALLLAPSDTRTVGKKGLRYENGLYWDDPETSDHSPDSLINWVRRDVMIRPDLGDAGRLFCFDPETKAFICQARDMAISGITVGEKIAAKKRARKADMKRVAAMKTLAETVGDPLAEEIERIKRDKGSVFNLPVGAPVEGNPFVDAAMEAAEAGRHSREDGNPDSSPGSRIKSGMTGSPHPSAKNSQHALIFPDQALVGQASSLSSDDRQDACPTNPDEEAGPNVIRLPLPEPEELDLTLVTEPITIFELLRVEQRRRKPTDREIQFLTRTMREWRMHALMTWEAMEERDRAWLLESFPEEFQGFFEEVNQ